MANLDVIEFECPRCLDKIRVTNEKAGQRIDCPSCGGSLLVPSQTAGQELFDDIFESSSQVPAEIEAEPEEVTEEVVEESDAGLIHESDEDILSGVSTPENEPSLDEINPLEGDDPFEINEDAPLKVDGIGDIFGHADVYGFKCNICDTRIHVRPDQANTYVECPECFTKLLVKPPKKAPPAQRWVKENHDRSPRKESDDEELRLSDPVERPKEEVDKSYGLAPPSEDLLAPKPKQVPESDDDEYGLEIIDDEVPDSTADKKTPKAPASIQAATNKTAQQSGKSRREIYEESQRRQQAEEAGVVYDPDESSDPSETTDFPKSDMGSSFAAAITMVKSPGVIWRVAIAVALMCFGVIAMESFYPASTPPPEEGAGGTMTDRLTQSAGWLLVGGVPYLLGLLMLWFTCGYIFRDAALGHRQVKSWKNAGTSELIGTFLIFCFGFFIGGLPALFIVWLIIPLRVLLGPLFLLSAWYSRAPFSIVNVDAFKNVTKEMSMWTAFYGFMSVLAFIGFIAGLMFRVRAIEGTPFITSMILSIPAVLISVAITLIFAAVCGWHCGRVVEGLEKSR